MPDISYAQSGTGDWIVLLDGATVLAVEHKVGQQALDRLWALIASGATPGAIIDELISGGLSAAPAFVLIAGSDPAARTALVRGPATLRTVGAAGVREIGAEGVSSWVEQVVDTSGGFAVEFKSGGRRTSLRPLRSGVVAACAIQTADLLTPIPDQEAPIRPPAPGPAPTTKTPDPIATPPAAPAQTAAVDLEATLASQTTTRDDSRDFAIPPPPPAPVVESGGYDHLFGETVHRSVEDAAVRTEPDGAIQSPSADPAPDGGDHDGHTVMVSDLAALRARRRAARATVAPEPEPPRLFLQLSTGGTEWLDQPLVIGRAPSASRVRSGKVPRIVSMNTPNQDISRTHAEVVAEGGTVVVTDLHSSNGTSITLPGKPTQRLRPGEPATVIVGTVIDLGDGATLTVCEASS